MVITDTQENTKPPGRTRGLRPAHETARTLRHHYERKSCERVKDAYSIPHPVPPKITPRARMVPATAPISLLVATLTVQREKEHYYHPVKNKQQASASELWMKWLPFPFKAPPPPSPRSDVQHNRVHFTWIMLNKSNDVLFSPSVPETKYKLVWSVSKTNECSSGCKSWRPTFWSWILTGVALFRWVRHATVRPCPGGITSTSGFIVAHLYISDRNKNIFF